MHLHVEFSTTSQKAHAAVKVQLRDGKWWTIKEWSADRRCLDVNQLDDIFACVACELDVQHSLL